MCSGHPTARAHAPSVDACSTSPEIDVRVLPTTLPAADWRRWATASPRSSGLSTRPEPERQRRLHMRILPFRTAGAMTMRPVQSVVPRAVRPRPRRSGGTRLARVMSCRRPAAPPMGSTTGSALGGLTGRVTGSPTAGRTRWVTAWVSAWASGCRCPCVPRCGGASEPITSPCSCWFLRPRCAWPRGGRCRLDRRCRRSRVLRRPRPPCRPRPRHPWLPHRSRHLPLPHRPR